MDGYRYTRTYTHTQTSIYIQSTMDLNVKGHGWWLRPVTLLLFNEVNQGAGFFLLKKIAVYAAPDLLLGPVYFGQSLLS